MTLALLFAVFSVVSFTVLRTVIAPAFDDLELAAARSDLIRAEGAIQAGKGGENFFSAEQAEIRAVGTGRIYERMWEFLTHGDPE